MKPRVFVLLLSLLFITSLHAQQSADSWDWKVAPYLWLLNGDGGNSVGPIEGDMEFDFADILENLDFAGQLFIAADRGHHGFHGDVQFLSLEPDAQPARIGPGEIQSKLELTTVEGAYRYHFSGTDAGSTLLVGARYIDTTVTLTPTLLSRVEAKVDWTDGFLGYQYVGTLTDLWDSQFQLTAGAGGSDLTLTTQLMFFRETKGGNHWAIGARIWDIDYRETLGNDVPMELDLTMYGLVAGFVFD